MDEAIADPVFDGVAGLRDNCDLLPGLTNVLPPALIIVDTEEVERVDDAVVTWPGDLLSSCGANASIGSWGGAFCL